MMPRVTFWASLTDRSRRERTTAEPVVADRRATCGAAERTAVASLLRSGTGRLAVGGIVAEASRFRFRVW